VGSFRRDLTLMELAAMEGVDRDPDAAEEAGPFGLVLTVSAARGWDDVGSSNRAHGLPVVGDNASDLIGGTFPGPEIELQPLAVAAGEDSIRPLGPACVCQQLGGALDIERILHD